MIAYLDKISLIFGTKSNKASLEFPSVTFPPGFLFTIVCFLGLYVITKSQLAKEQNKFNVKFGELNSEQVKEAKKQKIYKEIIATEIFSKI